MAAALGFRSLGVSARSFWSMGQIRRSRHVKSAKKGRRAVAKRGPSPDPSVGGAKNSEHPGLYAGSEHAELLREVGDESPAGFAWWKESFQYFRAPTLISVDEWADAHRLIAPEFSASPGQWRTVRVEFLREVMRATSPAHACKRVVLLKSTQIGGSESLVLNVIAHTIDVAPRSILCVFPTLELAEAFAKERIEPMIAMIPRLQQRVAETSAGGTRGRQHDRSTMRGKRFAGGWLNLVGANSTSGLSSRPVPIAIMDEVDSCVQNAGRSGNPVRLLTARTSTFRNKKEIFLGSPSNAEEETGILQLWHDSSRGWLETSCPNAACAAWQVLDFTRMDLGSATLACVQCGERFDQRAWNGRPFAESQRWRHENEANTDTRGFRLSGLNSPWVDWRRDLCDEYKEAKRVAELGDDSLLRVFVNTRLALPYKLRGERVEIDFYHERRERYACHEKSAELPDEVLVVTAAVDIMDSWLAYEIVGWGRHRESWGIEAGVIEGDARVPAGAGHNSVWDRLDKLVYSRVLRYADGSLTRVRLLFVDSGGHCTSEAYKYCKPRHPRVFALKGVGGEGKAIIIGGRQREHAEGTWLVRIGVDTLKDDVVARLEIATRGGGFCHFPCGADGADVQGYNEQFFRELVSEARVLKYSKGGFAKYEWHKLDKHERNEAFDLRVYNRAALEYLRVRLESMSRDTLRSVSAHEISRIEAGLGREILNLKRAPKREQRASTTTSIAPEERDENAARVAPVGGREFARPPSSSYGAMTSSF